MSRVIVIYLLLSLVTGGTGVAQTHDQAKPPYTETDILDGLKRGGMSSKRMAVLVGQRGVDFTLTPEVERELQQAGAERDLINAIRNNGVSAGSSMATVDGSTFASEQEAKRYWELKHLEKAGKMQEIRSVADVHVGDQLQCVHLEGGKMRCFKPISETAAGATKVNSRDTLTYVWIAPGTFQMGCSSGDSECLDDEKPTHSVTISKGFWMGQTPVTQAAYQRVRGTNPSYFKGDQRPVEQVTWFEARDYCSAVGMRLPTEAEWEYAARAGSTAARYGDLDAVAWYSDNSGNARADSTALGRDQQNYLTKLYLNGNQTHPVMEKQPNGWKLYDMLGNVWEWTGDWYGDSYYSQSPSQEPQGPNSGEYRALRGGSWESEPRKARVSVRGWGGPGGRGNGLGFRCAGETLP
jgi:formylglycine-generating enzyme required for sulfatase activity